MFSLIAIAAAAALAVGFAASRSPTEEYKPVRVRSR
ncbi:hypothetical protein OG2516_13409 [Oceanicola granulosus HTCC2516]|uniref:Uncharacterized protein n=1 Tax=Oceanicola granulosus (strain ATCC BAA-861 / DSM 15982 / KCTC 12143 / HTCC2516) TaxID=314256 RepID=Q2CGY6_OCEGH|nr:hypothetical protein OG2516_13409 [Oceanicola granulosus HTCC2516]